MNPARSFGPALLAGRVESLWIYFLAPPLGMLLAAEFVRPHRRDASRSSAPSSITIPIARCIFTCRFGVGRLSVTRANAPTPHLSIAHIQIPAADRVATRAAPRSLAMPATTHYDVIIIGTGAGGGTLAHRLAPSGKRILLLERGGYVPREKDNWSSRAVNVEGKYHTKEVWHTPTAIRCIRTPTTTSAATPNSTARRCSGCGAKTSGSCATTAACRRPGRSATTISSRTTPKPNGSITSTANAAGIRPNRRRSAPYPFPARQPRAAHPEAARRSGAQPACGRSMCRIGVMLDEQQPADEPLHSLQHVRRLSLPGPREVGRGGLLRRRRRWRIRMSRC